MLSFVSVTGIDGSGKTSCADALISRLSKRYKAVKIDGGDPYLFFNGQKKQLIKNRLYHTLQKIRPRAEKYGLGGCFILLHFLYKLCITSYVTKLVKTDFVIFDTDLLLHPAAYSILHFPFLKGVNESWMFKALYKLSGSKRNSLIFYLEADPAGAITRIEKRSLPSDSHENICDLKLLIRAFDRILAIASNYGLHIVRIETANRTVDSIVDEIETVLNKELDYALTASKYTSSDADLSQQRAESNYQA
jgi:thymidylate kinase